MQTKELLAEIDSLKAEIEKLRPLKPEVEHRIMQKFRLDWNYHSNAIEGNQLTLGETRAFLMEGLTASGKPLKDHLDIKGHNELIDFLQLYIQQKQELTEADIREMHKILLREPYDTEAVTEDGRIVKKRVELGVYKKTPNFVRTGAGQIHQYISPDDVEPKMYELVTWNRDHARTAELHPLVHAAFLHHRFLEIHPFDDGNGRLGRILMNLILMRHGFPPVVVKLSQRDRYVSALRQADVNEKTPLFEFLAECLLDSMRLYLRGAKGESIEDSDGVDKQVALLKQELLSVPSPLQRTWEVQEKLIRERLGLLVRRLDKKLILFDELFENHVFRCHYQWMVGGEDLLISEPNTCLNSLLELLHREHSRTPPSLFRKIQFSKAWEGFQKDGMNAFNVHIGFWVSFEKWHFSIESLDVRFKQSLDYSSWLSEDEENSLVSSIAKEVLVRIQNQRRNNKQR